MNQLFITHIQMLFLNFFLNKLVLNFKFSLIKSPNLKILLKLQYDHNIY